MNASKIFLWVGVAFMLLFAFFQWNDPDPQVWIPLYLIPAFLIYKKIKDGYSSEVYFFTAAVYFLWALNQFPPAWEGVLLDEMGMKTLNIELGRESLGLGIVSILLVMSGLIKK